VKHDLLRSTAFAFVKFEGQDAILLETVGTHEEVY
jgi:hypothetical protein